MTPKKTQSRFLFWAFLIYTALSLSSMALMSIGASLLIVTLILDQGGPKRFYNELSEALKTPSIRAYGYASLLFFLACTASLVFARYCPLTFAGRFTPVRLPQDLAKTWYLILPLFLVVGWRRLLPEQKTSVIKTWFIVFGVLSAVGVVQFFTGLPRAQENPYLPGYYHVILLFGHHLSLASIWIFPFFALLDTLLDRESVKKLKIPFPILFLFFGLGGFALFFSYSRTLWAAMPIGLILWSWLKLPRKLAAWGTGIAIFLTLVLIQTPQVKNRIESNMGVPQRTELWNANLEFLKARPITGVGLGKNHELSLYYFQQKHPETTDFFIGHAHNIYLEIIAGLGIFGLITWLFWLMSAMRPLVLLHNQKFPFNFSSGFLAAWAVFLLNGLTQVNFWDGKVLHQVMWVTGMTLFFQFQKEASKK